MDIKKINRSSLALFNSIILALILVILSYMAFNGNGRYQLHSGLVMDTKTGTVYPFRGAHFKFILNKDGYYERITPPKIN